jgi:8-oxo-dGTP pyrophosphatase MutT (NUDIX family)
MSISMSDPSHVPIHAVADLPEIGGPERERLVKLPGEIVLILKRSDGRIWLQTKDFYPSGVFRLATGKLDESEPPEQGFRRELHEEAGIVNIPADLLGRIEYSDRHVRFRFVSYLYVVPNVEHTPQPIDDSEGITEWKAVDRTGMIAAANTLRSLPGTWSHWGQFRAVVHDVILHLQEKNRI